jgi:hypothetical protein
MLARIVRVAVSTSNKNGLTMTEDFSVSGRRDEKTNLRWGGFGLL